MKITISITKDDGTNVQETFSEIDLAKGFLDQFLPPKEEEAPIE